jgi:hypothetical protein
MWLRTSACDQRRKLSLNRWSDAQSLSACITQFTKRHDWACICVVEFKLLFLYDFTFVRAHTHRTLHEQLKLRHCMGVCIRVGYVRKRSQHCAQFSFLQLSIRLCESGNRLATTGRVLNHPVVYNRIASKKAGQAAEALDKASNDSVTDSFGFARIRLISRKLICSWWASYKTKYPNMLRQIAAIGVKSMELLHQ